MRKPGQEAEIEAGERIQGSVQACTRGGVLSNLLGDSAKQSADTGRLGVGNFEQALQAPFF